MKSKKLLLKFLILALVICGVFTLTSCVTSAFMGGVFAKTCGGGFTKNDVIEYELNEDEKSYTLSYVPSSIQEVIIPEKYKGLPVTKIGRLAFVRYNSVACGQGSYIGMELNKLVIPSSVLEIEDYAFMNEELGAAEETSGYRISYGSIDKLYFNGTAEQWCNITFGCSPFSHETQLFMNGSLVTDFIVPQSVTVIGENVFCRYSGLKTLTLHGGVTEICKSAFQGCKNLETAFLLDGRLKIGDLAFAGCESLSKVTIEGVLSDIGGGAFANCKNLENIDLSGGIFTAVSAGAFSGCEKLRKIVIPQTVETIEQNAFLGCIDLLEVYNLSELVLRKGSMENGGVAYYALAVYSSLDDESLIEQKGDFVFMHAQSEGEKII